METSTIPPLKKVAFHTLGCRLNSSETGTIAQGFADRGYQVVELGQPADVVFLNTCTVTDGADSSCRHLIRKARTQTPQAKIIVAGCYAQMEAEKLRAMEGVDLVLGTSEKYRVFDYLDTESTTGPVIHINRTNDFWGAASTPTEGHTRAFLKIQDGCNYVCSFCIIPFARGPSRTISVGDALKEARQLLRQGYKEIVLTGVNVGEYEASSGEKLSELCKRLLEEPGLLRFRLSSVEPNTITKELLQVLQQSGKYQPHFHVPLQSGSDRVLKAMRRKYEVARYREVMAMIHEFFPGAAIGADVIAGFPGETEEDFLQTFHLLREGPHTHLHVFPFSKRKNTTAAKLPQQVATQEKKRRVRDLIMLGEAKLDAYARERVGLKTTVLFESSKEGWWEGYTPEFIRVRMRSESPLKNEIRQVLPLNWSGTHFEVISC